MAQTTQTPPTPAAPATKAANEALRLDANRNVSLRCPKCERIFNSQKHRAHGAILRFSAATGSGFWCGPCQPAFVVLVEVA